jgi:hypothetical protein
LRTGDKPHNSELDGIPHIGYAGFRLAPVKLPLTLVELC